MNPIILVQARMGSERLPGKVLMDICGKPMIQHVMERCLEVPAVRGRVVLLTSAEAEDEPLRAFGRAQGWMVYAPSVPAANVGQRY